jgi:uroporphyrinogen-III synthase
MRVLLTRSADENQKLERWLNRDLFEPISWDLIEYSTNCHPEQGRHPELDSGSYECLSEILNQVQDEGYAPITDIILTSKYAASLMNDSVKNMNFWVVGQESAKILQSKGFNVNYIAKNVDDLIANLRNCHPEQGSHPELVSGSRLNIHKILNQVQDDCYSHSSSTGKIIYLSGNKITKNMPKGITRHIIYKVNYKSSLSHAEIEQARQGLDYILLYSQNCAKILLELLRKYGLLESLKSTKIIAISQKVANIVRLYFKNIIYCVDDNYDQMLEILEDDARQAKSKI